jgi:hypothetical protein
MRLVEADARRTWLTAAADVVLLDPMYPEAAGGGRAQGRGLHLLRLLVGDDDDQDELLRWRAARRAGAWW